jgi:toxin-antitoxin system PIN domain toxin
MLVDGNLLLFAADASAPAHERAAAWLTAQLSGGRRVGLPWEALNAFLRISTHPRAAAHPLTVREAWRFVQEWLSVPVAWVPVATDAHGDVLGALLAKYQLTGNLIPDAHLAAIAIEHGLEVCSADTDFARFTEIRWTNPLA